MTSGIVFVLLFCLKMPVLVVLWVLSNCLTDVACVEVPLFYSTLSRTLRIYQKIGSWFLFHNKRTCINLTVGCKPAENVDAFDEMLISFHLDVFKGDLICRQLRVTRWQMNPIWSSCGHTHLTLVFLLSQIRVNLLHRKVSLHHRPFKLKSPYSVLSSNDLHEIISKPLLTFERAIEI